MVYDEREVLRSPSLSHFDDPGAEELNGFVDEYESNNNSSSGSRNDLSLSLDRKGRRWWCNGKFLILLTAAFALVGLCAGAGIIFGGDENAIKAAAASNHNHAVPPVPSDLHVICAPMNIQDDKGYNDCLEICQPAKCCEIIAENDLSCVEQHRNTCEQYRASCQHLDHKKATDDSSTMAIVDKVCAADALMTSDSVKTCTDTCESFSCCFDGTDDECDISKAICADNGACATALLVDPDGFASPAQAKAGVQTACQDLSTYRGQTQCSNVCNPAMCCFLSESAWTHPCAIDCDHYESCSALYGPILRKSVNETSTTVADDEKDAVFSIPHQVENACNPANLESVTGVRECFDLCEHHLCCFDGIEAGGCPDTNPAECHLYSACRALVEIDKSKEQPNEMCAADLVASDGPAECMKACRKGYCCLMDSRFESSCASDQICDNYYKGCQILAPEQPAAEDKDLVKNINKVCTESNLASVLGATECERECSQRSCCLETGAGNCKTSDLKYCDEVISCSLLFTVDPTPEIDEPAAEEEDVIPDAVTEKLKHVCTESNFETLSGYHNCYDQCYYHLCCFSFDPAINCKEKKAEECAAFAPCEALLAKAAEYQPDTLGDACSSSSTETRAGLEKCREQCAPRLCCFQDPNLPSSCIGWYGMQECQKYDSCKVLVSDASHSVYNQEDPYLVGLIDNYCQADKLTDEEDARSCMAHCQKRSCCFNDGECWKTDSDWCNEIIACANHPLITAHTSGDSSDSGATNTTAGSEDEDVNGDDDEPEPDEEDDVDVLGDDKLQDESNSTASSEDVDEDDDEPEPDEEDDVDLVGDDKIQDEGNSTTSSEGNDEEDDGPEPDKEDDVDLFGDDLPQDDSPGDGGNGGDDKPEPDQEDDVDLFGDEKPSSGGGGGGGGLEPKTDDDIELFGDDSSSGGEGGDQGEGSGDDIGLFGGGDNRSDGDSSGSANGEDEEPPQDDDIDLFKDDTTRDKAAIKSSSGGSSTDEE